MPNLHVTDRQSGKAYDMPWDGQAPPTDADIDTFLSKQGGSPVTDGLVNSLPAIGGAAGGILGKVPVLGTALAALGGAGGEGYRQTIEALRGNFQNVPETMLDRIKAMGLEGAKQAGYESGGRLVGHGLQAAGQKLYTSAIKPSLEVLTDMPGAMRRGVSEGILSPTRAAAKTTAAREAVDSTLAQAEASGVPGVSRRSVASSLSGEPKAAVERRVALGGPDQTPMLAERARGIHRNNPAEIPLTRANALKREAQTVAYESGRDNLAIKKQAEDAIASSLKTGIERRVPAVGPMNAKTQDYLGLSRSLDNATTNWSKGQPWLTSLLVGSNTGMGTQVLTGDPIAALLAALGSGAVASPAARARMGVTAYQVGRPSVTPNIVRAVDRGIRRKE